MPQDVLDGYYYYGSLFIFAQRMFIIIIKTELKDLGLNSRQISRMCTCNIFVDILLSSVLVSQKELPMKEEGR